MSTDDVVEQMGDVSLYSNLPMLKLCNCCAPPPPPPPPTQDDSVSVIKKGEGSNVPPPQVGGWAANMTTKGRNSLFSTEEEE